MPRFDLPLDELRSYRPEIDEPADFDDFWRRTLAEARAHPPAATSTPVDNRLAVLDSYDLTFAGYGGHPVRGWLHVPAGATGPLPAVVEFLGYSRGRGPAHQYTLWAQAGWAHFVMDTRGQGWTTGGPVGTPDPSADAGFARAPGFLTAGIGSPETYYYRRVYVDAVRMLEVAAGHELVDPARIVVTGASQGGGITVAAAGLAALAGLPLVGAAPDVPFLCHFRRALEITDQQPYAELVAYLAGWRDQTDAVHRTLSYFDGVNLARRAQAPALFSVGLMDPVCPPSTVFAAFNAYAEQAPAVAKEITVYPYNQHEGGAGYQLETQLDWFRELFGADGIRA